MTDTTDPIEQLLDALAENSLIKAAVLVDTRGRVKSKRGEASVLKISGGPAPSSETRENVFMLEVEGDILVVIFDHNASFEQVRSSTFRLMEHVGVALPSDD